MKKVINEKVQNVRFYTVNKNGVKTLLKSSDISYLYFYWKNIFGTAEPEIGHDYAITKTLLKVLKKDGEKGLNTVRRYMGRKDAGCHGIHSRLNRAFREHV